MTPVSLEKERPRDARAAFARLEAAVTSVIHGKREAVRLAIAALAARGHLLIEDVPGVGKTTLARALARSLGGTFRRIQFTSDLLPSDILGVSVFAPETGRFDFRPGPIFANVVLADEINRTTPRTQSSLLEAMSEARVSLDNHTYDIPQPFIVVATQNPLEHFGTYPLPESQMDRFLLRIRMGYPSAEDERRVVTASADEDPAEELKPAVDAADVAAMQTAAARVKVDGSLLDYAQKVVEETRHSPFLQLGISPRGFQGWFRAAQARALAAGRDFAVPDDFKEMALPALAHRVVTSGGATGEPLGRAREEAERVLNDLLERVPVPA
ncbi:MAG TPA: AAA family ATPase [Polyangia bacterium]|nr:AAA family ATPase [Polyangia bacterium]